MLSHYTSKGLVVTMELLSYIRAVTSGVKGGNDYKGPRLRKGPLAISTDLLRLRTVDGPLLRVVTSHVHVFLSLA